MGTKKEWKPTRLTGVRKIDRSVAKYNMEKAGFNHINKRMSKLWRDYAYLG